MPIKMSATMAALGIGGAGIFLASAGILPSATTNRMLTSAHKSARIKVEIDRGSEKGFT